MMVLLLSLGINLGNISVAEKLADNATAIKSSVDITTTQENSAILEMPNTITIHDPVATYNGIPISKEEFLDYMEGQTGMRADEFYDARSLEIALRTYLLQKHKMEKVKELEITMDEDNALEAQYIRKAVLANNALSRTLISEEQLASEKMKVDDASLDHLEIFAKFSYPSVSFEEIKNNFELLKVIQDAYKTQTILSMLAEKAQLDQDKQFKINYEGIILNFWGNKYDEYFVQHLPTPTQKELDESFNQWLQTQDFNRYKIAHIYLKDKTMAERLLKEIQNKTISFADAAKKYSLDKNSKEYGGKLQQGWWTSFVEFDLPLAVAARTLKAGELLPEVIGAISDGYYHIVYLEDIELNDVPEEYIKNDVFQRQIWEQFKLDQENELIKMQFDISINY